MPELNGYDPIGRIRQLVEDQGGRTPAVALTEPEILSLHEKLDELREMKWSELITMQQEQLRC
jgi:hypothetical protein